jgi:hypothetical protein
MPHTADSCRTVALSLYCTSLAPAP